MADTAKKTPNKRKSLPAKLGSAKKQKLVKQTPQKFSTESKEENSVKKLKQNNAAANSPKQMKPFPGIKSPKNQGKESKKHPSKQTKTTLEGISKKQGNNAESKSMKKRRPNFYTKLDHLRAIGDEAEKSKLLPSVEEKIKLFESRGDLTKTAKRKLNTLLKYKAFAEGTPIATPQSNVAAKAGKKEQKKAVQQKKAVNGKQQLKQVSQESKGPKQKNKPQLKNLKESAAKKSDILKKEESEDDEEDEEDVMEEASDEEEEDSDNEQNEDDNDEEEEEEDGEDNENEVSDDESEDEVQPPPKEKASAETKQSKTETSKSSNVNLEDLKKSHIIAQTQKRYVLFVGNIPYDTTKKDLYEHFQKCGEIKHIRIPTDKGSNKPRGFAYVEVSNADVYQKSLSIHHTFLKGRRINVLYTTGGKKKGEEKKKDVKVKNLKLHAMRKKGQLLGSKKETQKRSFRRKKQKLNKSEDIQE